MKKIICFSILVLIFYICLNNIEANEEKKYISDIEPTASSAYFLKNNNDADGNKFSLLKEDEEVVYEKGILAVPSANSYSSIYFTNIQEYNYKFFETDIGINGTARDIDTSVEFKVYADGKLIYSSGEFTNDREVEHIKISLEGINVLQLVVDSLGANSSDYAVWGNAFFVGNKDTPYLAVDDLEFNLK